MLKSTTQAFSSARVERYCKLVIGTFSDWYYIFMQTVACKVQSLTFSNEKLHDICSAEMGGHRLSIVGCIAVCSNEPPSQHKDGDEVVIVDSLS